MNALRNFCLVAFALACMAVMSNGAGLVGAPEQLQGDELKEGIELLNTTLSKLATGDGPNYKAGKTTSVTRQLVAGWLYQYTVELLDGNVSKQCNVKIWSQPWIKENGTEITIKCDGDADELKKAL